MSHVIVGGGVAGLATAFYLTKQSGVKRITVLESSKRLGGWIDTTRNKDGILYEHGPRTIRPVGPQGANTLAMVQELGLSDKVRSVKLGEPSTINRMVYVNGELYKLPSTLISLFKSVVLRFGEDIAQYAVDPLVRGICAGNSREISVHFIAKYLHELEQSSGSVLKGYLKDYFKNKLFPIPKTKEEECDLVKLARSEHWSVWGLENGLTTLTEALKDKLLKLGVEIFTDYKVQDLYFRKEVCMVNGSIPCDKLTLAQPSFAAAQLLKDSSLPLELHESLATIPYVDVAVVNLEFKGNILKNPGFGFLVPSNQPEPILGCIFDTCTFKQGDRTIFTVMMGGAWFNSLFKDKTQAEIECTALETVQRILKFQDKPTRSKTKILRNCIAQYTVGHLARVKTARDIINQGRLPLSIVGSSYDGVGINDTILSARRSVGI
ncbi:protoporphyrinogen oxidase [Eurytemora carolleeae]|uniref:protoporphyrinogen oxidase n=1 Tax=Eurytemora carolleeae TaxID=1294199 RepID=UPI000C76FE38|nr:protoporphyrinogen oxidase [Eurytemora carolleeae]|eukprot:XP_023334507.1 protoporphyrinogen oxidase-like [Eurytemora affinis]